MAIVLSLVSLSALSAEQLPDKNLAGKLSISPSICVVEESDSNCDTMITVAWQSDQATSACLYRDNKKLFCWTDKQQVEENIYVVTNKPLDFAVVNERGEAISNASFQLFTNKPKNMRRKLLSDWSIF